MVDLPLWKMMEWVTVGMMHFHYSQYMEKNMFQTTNQLSSSKVWPSCAVGLTAGYLFRYHLTNLDAEIELWRVGCAKSNRHVLDTWLITLPSNLLHSGILRFDKKWKPMVPRNYLDTSFPKHQRRFKKHVDSIRNEKCFPPSQIHSVVLEYLPTSTLKITQMSVNIPYMENMGMKHM